MAGDVQPSMSEAEKILYLTKISPESKPSPGWTSGAHLLSRHFPLGSN